MSARLDRGRADRASSGGGPAGRRPAAPLPARATVIGLAREGVDLARFLVRRGVRVRVNDQKPAEALGGALEQLRGLPIDYVLGGHPLEPLLDADVLFVSPGVPQELPVIQEARRRGIEVSSATRLFFQLCPAPIIGITGSSGKSTTTSLVGEAFRAAGRSVLVGGNIGVPLLGRLDEIGPETAVVLELSSFQLETLDRSPDVAAVTNVSPNHLDRHGSFAAYRAAKANIFRFQGPEDWTVLNADDPGSAEYAPPGRALHFSLVRPVEGAYLRGSDLVLRLGGSETTVCRREELRLRGRHNVANALAAGAVAAAAGAPVAALRAALTTFAGVPHRLEPVAEIAGVRYYNDSIATSPERALRGLESFDEPIVLIAGGRDKHLPLDALAAAIVERCRGLVLIGELADAIAAAVRAVEPGFGPVRRASSLAEAVELAAALARPGDVVLLSPGGTSFDWFRDFEERGEAFRQAVRALAGRPAAPAGGARAGDRG